MKTQNNYFRNMQGHVESTNQLLDSTNSIVVFDTETTGLAKDAKIIQFSAVTYKVSHEPFELTEQHHLDLYINPEEKLDSIITELTGISDEQLENAPTEDRVGQKIFDYLNKSDVWCAYNSPFDIAKLEGMAGRLNLKPEFKPCIDALLMAKNVIKKSDIKNHKLGTITEYFYPDYEAKFHNSLEDVRATGKCLVALANEYKKKEFDAAKKEIPNVSWASFWRSPYQWNLQRIKIFIDRKDSGIFWDCLKYCWSCKKDKNSQANFDKYDIGEIEKQVLYRYKDRFEDIRSMDDLGREWSRAEDPKRVEKTPDKDKDNKAADISEPEPIAIEDEYEEVDIW